MGICFGKSAKLANSSSGQFIDAGTEPVNVEPYKLVSTFSSNLKAFNFNDLKSATRNFHPDSVLGKGRFGYVFMGWIDEHTLAATEPGTGKSVAVKMLNPEGFQDHKKWLADVNYLGQLYHENVVKLIGYSSESDHRLLVHEVMPKGSLESHLFKKGVQAMPWAIRMKIAVDVARGLCFLHALDEKVIYLDLKSSKILLDSDFTAKLCDFGLTREGSCRDRTTRVIGTRGYALPEYIATGYYTKNSDVYSFGAVLLELLSGKRARGDENMGALRGYDNTLVDWAIPFLSKSRITRIMDTRLGGQYSKKSAQATVAVALACLDIDSNLRPSMSSVLRDLEEALVS